jgi:hypothetical protein
VRQPARRTRRRSLGRDRALDPFDLRANLGVRDRGLAGRHLGFDLLKDGLLLVGERLGTKRQGQDGRASFGGSDRLPCGLTHAPQRSA